MKVYRQCRITKQLNAMDIDVTEEQLRLWEEGMLVQEAMPHLSPDEREFLMTGITPQVWRELFGDGPSIEEDEDDN